jgi:hypothetical protein
MACYRDIFTLKFDLYLFISFLLYLFFVEWRQKRNAYRILVGNPEGKRPLGRTRRRLVHNIKMDLREIGWGGTDWIKLVEDRDQWRALVNTVMNLPKNTGKFLSACTIGGFSGRAQLHE